MSRRGRGSGRRGILAPSGGVASSMLEVVALSKVLAYYRADLGITDDPGVSLWEDQHTGGYDLSAAGAARPTYGATAGPNSTPAITFDGTANTMKNASLQLPTPGVGTVKYFMVCRYDIDTSFDTLICAGRSAAWECGLARSAAGLKFSQYNATKGNESGTYTIGTWLVVEALFVGSTSDELIVNGSITTGTSAGTEVPDIGLVLGSRDSAASTFAGATFAEVLVLNDDFDAGEDAATAAYVAARYGL